MAEENTLEETELDQGETQEQQEVDYKALYESEKANAEKWKAMSRKNEDAYKKAVASTPEGADERIAALEKRVQQAEQEAADLRRKQDIAAWAEAASKEHGVPASILRGETPEELMEHAAAIKASMEVAPVIRDSGEAKKPPKSSKAVFSEFMNSTFNS